MLLRDPTQATNIYFNMLPSAVFWPALLLATFATVIASQATISGVFSLVSQANAVPSRPTRAFTRQLPCVPAAQAQHLHFLPRISVVHTSDQHCECAHPLCRGPAYGVARPHSRPALRANCQLVRVNGSASAAAVLRYT
jgi:hypothetical protein